MFQIRDYCNEILDGTFYENELQIVKTPKYFKIEKILKTKKEKGRTKYLVKWMYYPGTIYKCRIFDLKYYSFLSFSFIYSIFIPECAAEWVDSKDVKDI